MAKVIIKTAVEIPDELDGYDWACAFEYAGERSEDSCFGTPCISHALPPKDGGWSDNDLASLEPFSRADVDTVYAAEEGDNDGPDWLVFGKLKDGRFFFLEAGCDYTGWDCQASGTAYVSPYVEDLIRFAMDDEDRRRLGFVLAAIRVPKLEEDYGTDP